MKTNVKTDEKPNRKLESKFNGNQHTGAGRKAGGVQSKEAGKASGNDCNESK
jgi:hypothetical protein